MNDLHFDLCINKKMFFWRYYQYQRVARIRIEGSTRPDSTDVVCLRRRTDVKRRESLFSAQPNPNQRRERETSPND